MKRMLCCCAVALAGAALWLGGAAPSPSQEPKTTPKVQYARDVQPILASHCFVCHGPDDNLRKAKLRLDRRADALKELRSGGRAVVPGKPEESDLFARVCSDGPDRMPPAKTGKALKQKEKDVLRAWIAQGAEYEAHWAFTSPKRPAVPATRTQGWAKNPVDHFILTRLEREGLQPSPEADRYTLARRAALDLTGLPPTPEEADRFVNDKSADAYEQYVDRLLQSPKYGERWAHLWLDLARYADSSGYAEDNPRTIWRYRDWLIDALNKNMPFDQFTVEQLAGDLLPNPTTEQLIATAFHRNTLSNDEGGTDDEEFRTIAVVDRVNTTMQVWMGLTLACAECHNHKYDPFTQEEYFRLYAVFNQTEDADRRDLTPVLATPTPEQTKRKAELEKYVASLDVVLAHIKARGKAPGAEADQALEKQVKERAAALRKEIAGLGIVSTPIMRELPEKKQRITKIHLRGNFLDQGKQVTPGVPGQFPPLPADRPADRLALARWLVDPANPLTARVAANRYWEQLFGTGLVETSEDYGIRGKLPTHPELLDWLATEFGAQKWDMKQMVRMLVTSAAYRQASRLTPQLQQRDPDNHLFARGPRFRVPAEAVRDQALAASGLLSGRMYGPPCRPPRPKLGLTAAFGGSTDWETSPGDDKHRRAVYTFIRRSTPYPSMATFDAPDRNACTVKRPTTNTPLQALVTLNDPVYVESAQALGRRMVKEGGATVESRLTHGFRLCLTRPPRAEELSRLVELFNRARTEYTGNRKEAEQLATQPIGPLPAGADSVDMAAWTVVGNVLLNLDEMFARR